MTARLIRIDWPDFGQPDLPPAFSLAEARARLAALRAAMDGRHDALVVYGDREHAANLQWLTGFDPRFEEALLVVTPDAAMLIAGNECLPYTQVSPLVAAGDVAAVHCATLSLPSQPRRSARLDECLADILPPGGRIGAIGWKLFEPHEVSPGRPVPLDLPGFVSDAITVAAGVAPSNATALMMDPGLGLRSVVDAAEIARLEFSNHMAASALRRMVQGFREGMTDFEAVAAAGIGGLPLSCHLTFATGARAAQGLSGPTGQTLRAGSPVSFNVAHWGSNICRAGWVARTAADLPVPAARYLEDFAFPYVKAISTWCGMMRPGVPGGEVWARMQALLPADIFAVELNPGHLIGLDEWVSSPIAEGSSLPLRSGMAMQCDVIPSHPVFGSTRMEEGYVIADAELRAELSSRFPAAAARCAARAAFMRDRIGLDVPDTLLPLADTCGIVAPFLLDPQQVIALR
jgi:Xaa-Pro aminopeptidase